MAAQTDWLEKDLYAVLGVAADADRDTISRAYRKLARELHPDTHPDDPEAAERFKEVTAAYDVLGDPTRRDEYDDFRRAVAGAGRAEPDGPEPDGAAWRTFDGGSLDDLLRMFMGGRGPAGRQTEASRGPRSPWPGNDLEAVLDLSFDDAVRGLTTEVTLSGPDGSHTFKVRVPPGVQDGQRIRLPGKGGPGLNGGPPGDLYAVVRVAAHPVFGRSGLDLTVDVSIGWPEAVLGTEIDVPTLGGSPVRVRVPAGTPHGRTLRVRGHGVRTDRGTGDLLVRVRVTVPDDLTEEQRRAVEAVAEAFRAA